jgi:subfamily B ATP-binding cassette protein MsbA
MSEKSSVGSGGELYRRLLRYVYPYWVGFAFAVVGMIMVAGTEIGFAALMKPMLDGTFVDKDPEIIKLVPLALLGIFLFRGLGGFAVRYFMDWVARNVIRDLRRLMFDHLLQLPASFYDRQSKGRLSAKLIYDVEQVAAASTGAITVLIRDTLTILGLLGWMIYLSWKLTLFFIVITPLIGIIVVIVSKRFRRINRRIQSSMGSVSQISQQAVDANRVVKIYGAQTYEKELFNDANLFNRRQYMKLAVTSGLTAPITQFFAAFALSGVLYVATQPEMLDVITPGIFVSFVSASLLLMPAMRRLTQVTENLQKGIAAAESVFDLLDQEAEKDIGTQQLENVKGRVAFENVSFRYPGSDALVLDNIDLTVEPGQSVAIVGRSGSGKTTLVSLIPRFYNVSEGSLTLDYIPVQELRLANLRKHIALVSQDITLFNDTVANNIAYGCKETVTRDQIINAATAAHAMEFINDLPQGLETLIGDKGMLVSGGQRQRIAIARALLKDAPILILDEATSALDTESERIIQQALEELMVGRTTFVIAHRLSTVERADKIIVMHEGKIVESGTHSELLNMDQHYAALHRMQFND